MDGWLAGVINALLSNGNTKYQQLKDASGIFSIWNLLFSSCVMASPAGYAADVLSPSDCIAAGLGHYLGGDKFCSWRAARCFAFPIISTNVVFVTGIDKSLICQRSRGDKQVAAIEWQRKGVINWRLTWAACSFVRRGVDGRTKEGRLVGCHKAFPCVQFVEPFGLSSKERLMASAAWILNPAST